MTVTKTRFSIGQVVRHRFYDFRGVIYDIDPEFDNTEEWWLSIPEEVRPRKDQPFYHLLAENETNAYTAYVSEQNLLIDDSGKAIQVILVANTGIRILLFQKTIKLTIRFAGVSATIVKGAI